MVLFVAYPSVSVKIFRLFNCVKVEGHYWLDADMALQCFTLRYWGYALYALTMVVVFVVGLPLGIFLVLWRRRAHLHGPGSEETMHRFGFLYEAYGPTALYWEVEELIRKLLLTAVAVLLDAGSPLQVCGLIPVPFPLFSRSLALSCSLSFYPTLCFSLALPLLLPALQQRASSWLLTRCKLRTTWRNCLLSHVRAHTRFWTLTGHPCRGHLQHRPRVAWGLQALG